MVEKKGSLQRDDLIRLRKLLHRKINGSLPLEELTAMAELPEETGVTIDFEAAEELGHPLVVLRPSETFPSALESLSTREREVAALIADGLANKEIAARLHIALGTVKDHVHNMLEKTGLANRTALAVTFRASAKVLSRDDDVNPSLDRN
jgi:DNA-binding NarL/FixJ family response regulator